MKTNSSRSLLVACVFALSGGLAVTGCQSTKSPALAQGTTASASIQTAADSARAALSQINVTLAALRNLTERPGDIPAQYKVVQEQIRALGASSAKISAAADTMRTKGDAYLADWARQVAAISDADLRRAAFERRAEVATKLQAIFQDYQRVKAEFVPFEASLADIQRSLGSDLSVRGLEVVKPYVAKAAAASEPLKASLNKLESDFRAVSLSLQPGGGAK